MSYGQAGSAQSHAAAARLLAVVALSGCLATPIARGAEPAPTSAELRFAMVAGQAQTSAQMQSPTELPTPQPDPSGEDAAEGIRDPDEDIVASRLTLRPIDELGVDVLPPPGQAPYDYARQRALEDPPPVGEVLVRAWPVLAYDWAAPGSRHNPLYFEEVNVERYGYSCCRCLQPAISAAHFFCTIPALPYLMVADCPTECVYTLGHYRPGNCNPWRRHCWPCDCHAASYEFLAVMSVIAVIP